MKEELKLKESYLKQGIKIKRKLFETKILSI